MKRIPGLIACLCLAVIGTAAADAPVASFPTPPQQNALWEHEDDELSNAAETLFRLGLPDPRGCEYREVFIDSETDPDRLVPAATSMHAWVIPHEAGQPGFAFGWDGMMFRVDRELKRVSVEDDVRKLPIEGPSSMSVIHPTPALRKFTPLVAVYLIRFGLREYADKGFKSVTIRSGKGSFLPRAAVDWSWQLAARSRTRFVTGSYASSLQDIVQVRKILAVLQNEIATNARDTDIPSLIKPLDFLDSLETECLRRLTPKPQSLSQQTRVQELIVNLEQVQGFDLLQDPNVKELVEYGRGAIPALIDTIEKDERLTRAFAGFTKGPDPFNIVPVEFVANVAFNKILKTDYQREPRESRSHYADRLRQYTAGQEIETAR